MELSSDLDGYREPLGGAINHGESQGIEGYGEGPASYAGRGHERGFNGAAWDAMGAPRSLSEPLRHCKNP